MCIMREGVYRVSSTALYGSDDGSENYKREAQRLAGEGAFNNISIFVIWQQQGDVRRVFRAWAE